jgi:hypothetical protein
MLEIKPSFFSEVYGFMANEFDVEDMRKDDLLLGLLKTLKMLYLFAQNKLQSPNTYFVLGSPASSIYISSLGQATADLSEGMGVSLWYYREGPSGHLDGRETIYEIMNAIDQGFSVKFNRLHSQLEFTVHHADGSILTFPLGKVGNKAWHHVTLTQSYTKCRSG